MLKGTFQLVLGQLAHNSRTKRLHTISSRIRLPHSVRTSASRWQVVLKSSSACSNPQDYSGSAL
ncbi:hypothetical protein F751_6894 [Auxenochlorella protothecoides]|uniref:Uncharacterized protein n=1 Tax=Auxenochlorella protothecoides TaxID=3075 RepID=A0A087SDX2_AUXPR|nr:hypothetical protein F751_6894 [Auxenochlorella protothecoides]KFM23926.1 hypothetical protein F751_6894 [Auxenochlorella protothecoides]